MSSPRKAATAIMPGPSTTEITTVEQGGRRKRSGNLVAVGSVIGGFIVWQIIGMLIDNPLFLATPVQAVSALFLLGGTGELWLALGVSAQEFVYGLVSGCVVGVLVGLVMAGNKTLRSVLSPWVSGLYASPIVALAPLLILWFGVGLVSKVVVVFTMVVFPVIINTEAGVLSTDPDHVEMAKSFGARRVSMFAKVSLPSAMPQILTGFRQAIGRGLIGVFVGELFGAFTGVGFLINNAAQQFDMPTLFAGLLIFAAAGILLTEGFRMVERRLVSWQGVERTKG